MLVDLGLVQQLQEIFRIPIPLLPPRFPGGLERAPETHLAQLLNLLYDFISVMCMWSKDLQVAILEFSHMYVQHLPIAGLSVSTALSSIVFDNYDIITKVGPQWITRIFEDFTPRYEVTAPGWLDLCARLVVCRL
jgi:hypothetical protein